MQNIGTKNPYAKKLFEDLGDNLSFEHTMRSFHAMPNTTIPNAQKAFAEFCYGNMPSCKEGDVDACSKINRRIGEFIINFLSYPLLYI